jgi:2'-5' RNA ligase
VASSTHKADSDEDRKEPPSGPAPKRLRLFIAINLPDPIKMALAGAQNEMASRVAADSVRWVHPPQIHLTLKFLGHLEENRVAALRSAIADACTNALAFRLSAEGLGCFPSLTHARVVWAGISGDLAIVGDLQKRIDLATATWAAPENRPFKAHLTLGRVTEPRKKTIQAIDRTVSARKSTLFGHWTVRQIDLMQSVLSRGGASYSRLASFPLIDG